MAVDFKALAEKTKYGSFVCIGRKKLSTYEIERYGVLTIDEFDVIKICERKKSVVHFTEIPDGYYEGGMVLTNICDSWAAQFDGNTVEASSVLAEQGGVEISIDNGRITIL